ncbi:MAG: hypothetical protein QGF00_07170 [Planctomycetota bacterium]|jgi:predicted metal-dependent HD superfamily phosphohydrolase|nr:hypothetical protein [Planctomycetota bacterium]MDP7249363.1 hypothetical protein [Planctomycetota bacterium]
MADSEVLIARWRCCCKRYSLKGADLEWTKLKAAYSAKERHYHNLTHINECLRLLDQHADSAEQPALIELALWYHDVVYDSRSDANEEQSCRVAAAFIRTPGIIDEASKLIMATTHREPPQSRDEELIIDIDLAILGSATERYGEYSRQIRREYSWLSDKDYRKGRAKVLQSFSSRERIYHTDEFQSLEVAARRNLETELEALKGI